MRRLVVSRRSGRETLCTDIRLIDTVDLEAPIAHRPRLSSLFGDCNQTCQNSGGRVTLTVLAISSVMVRFVPD